LRPRRTHRRRAARGHGPSDRPRAAGFPPSPGPATHDRRLQRGDHPPLPGRRGDGGRPAGRRLTPGSINRTDRWWQLHTGRLEYASDPWKPLFFAVYRDAATDRVDGIAAYHTDETWHEMLPAVNLMVYGLFATGPEAEQALWRYLLSIDWVARVKTGR